MADYYQQGPHHGGPPGPPPQAYGGYPPQGYPQQQYPQQGYPPQQYPPQQYPQQGYPPQQGQQMNFAPNQDTSNRGNKSGGGGCLGACLAALCCCFVCEEGYAAIDDFDDILLAAFEFLNRERDDGRHLKPCDVFDLIGGTSTGGLIAIMLGRLELDVNECIDAYSELMTCVFGEQMSHIPVDWSLNIRAKFDSKRLKAAIEHVISRAGASPSDLMDDGVSRRTKTFVCTTSRDTLQVTRLRSYSVPNEDILPATICEAALATSAATGFFEPVTIGNRQFVDGAFGANNPTEEVEEEAADIWCTTSREIKPLVKCFLTIGTGCAELLPMNDNIIKFVRKTLVSLVTKPQSTERRFMARWINEAKENRLFRFNVEQGLQNVRMDDCSQRSLIENATQDYLHHSSQKAREYKARLYQAKVLSKMHSSGDGACRPPPPCWVVPLKRNSRFVDREHVTSIKRTLFTKGPSQRIAVVGLGGVGKTQIALEVGHQVRDIYPDCAVFWIPAVDLESLRQSYQDIAYQLGLRFDPESEDVKVVVQNYLDQSHSGRWLLIIDNADELEMWRESDQDCKGGGLRAVLPKSDRGVVLFTTRSNKVAQYLNATDTIQILELDEHRATTVLQNCLVKKDLLNDTESTRQLLERLTYLPLAIVQAASFINQNETDIRSYVKLLDGQDQDVLDVLSEDFEDEGRYRSIRNPVATTWLTSFVQLQRDYPLASQYLAYMACINAKDIPISTLFSTTQLEKQKAIGVLVSYSFVRIRNPDSRLDLHRLVHLATRNWLRSLNSLRAWQIFTIRQMTLSFPPEDQLSERRALIPHALHILDSTIDEPPSEERVRLLCLSASTKFVDGRYKESSALSLLAIDCAKVAFGHDHPHTIELRGNLAFDYRQMGEYQKSINISKEAIEDEKKARGSETGLSMLLQSHLSDSYRCNEELEEAERLGTAVLKFSLDHCSLGDNLLYNAMCGLAMTYLAQGRLRESEELSRHLVSITERYPESNASDMWYRHANLIRADCYIEQFKMKEAEDIYTESIEIARETLGPEHPTVLRDTFYLAVIIKARMRHKEALSMMIECARLEAKVLGVDHKSTRRSYRRIEEWTTSKYVFESVNITTSPIEFDEMLMDHDK
ncbi:hypothetical protein N7466_010760 [Penicillium verhagenii]|uniref:uncharacterized protein n=1 Tax=Penicillium verhagenii TaxID=1562060 RepID=UPI002545A07E|nr:uncharacterized protein N7466_010760 [Penicillium verhagenii]KAJ5917206.1 hypothetical protein N7466_010760 [Penicillium verhagenii]